MTYPTIRPELTLDFANSRQLDPRITFSRTSGATYLNPDTGLITLASDHEARFEKEGLLVEEARTNSVTTSGDVKTAAYATQNGTSSYVTGIAPDGSSSTTLTNWVPDSGATDNALYGIANPGTPAAASVFIKANGWNYAGLWFNNIDGSADGRIFIDLTTGEVLADVNMSSITVVKCANGWWRVGGSSSTNALGTLSIKCSSSSGSSVTPAMNGTDGILLWGLQTEAGTFVTSLIPTSGSTVTRAADVCDITGTNLSSWWNASQWTVFIDVKRSFILTGYVFTAHGNNKDKRYSLSNQAFIERTHLLPSGGSTTSYPNPTLTSPYTYKAAAAKNVQGSDDGVAYYDAHKANDSGASFLCADLTPAKVEIGYCTFFATTRINGHLSRLTYYTRRLTDSELQTITL